MAHDDSGTRPFFHIIGELDPSEGEPADGMTYLKTVRWETNRMDDVNVAEIDPRQYDQFQTRKYGPSKISSLTVPNERLPSIQWQDQLIETITHLREMYFEYRQAFEDGDDSTPSNTTYPDLSSEQEWAKFCCGGETSQTAHEPLLSHLIWFDEVAIIRLLNLHIKWSRESTFSWSPPRLRWLFSLLVCLDLPIDAALQAELCDLRKSCLEARASSDNHSGDLIAGLNVLITVLERIFGQRDV